MLAAALWFAKSPMNRTPLVVVAGLAILFLGSAPHALFSASATTPTPAEEQQAFQELVALDLELAGLHRAHVQSSDVARQQADTKWMTQRAARSDALNAVLAAVAEREERKAARTPIIPLPIPPNASSKERRLLEEINALNAALGEIASSAVKRAASRCRASLRNGWIAIRSGLAAHLRLAKGGERRSIACFVWDGLTIAEERDAANTATKRFYSQGEQKGATTLLYRRDHLGSIRETTNTAGVVQARIDYDLWGKRTLLAIAAGNSEPSFGYTGHYWHARSSLHLAPYRAYSAELGRWISRDAFGGDANARYSYVANMPSVDVDVLGQVGLWELKKALGGLKS